MKLRSKVFNQQKVQRALREGWSGQGNVTRMIAEGSFPQGDDEIVPGLCSVICTTYNHAKYSRAAIESIVAQDFRPIEIVVIDDGSTDGNAEVIRAALADSDVSHSLIVQENTGNVAMNANRALAVARGEIVLLTSLDDLLLPGCISSKVTSMLVDSSLVMVGNSTNAEVDGAGNITALEIPNAIFGREDASAEEMRELEFQNIGTFFLQGTAFRADMLALIGRFEEDISGDDLILRTKVWNHLIANPELRFFFLPQPGFAYRKHGENLHGNTFRQMRTVLEWRNRYFADRPLPELAHRWALHHFNQCLIAHDQEALDALLVLDPEMSKIFATYRATWKYRRRAMKQAVKRMFRVPPASPGASKK